MIRIIHTGDWVRARADGTLDRAAGERLLADVVAAARELTDFHVVLDTRRASSALDEAGVREIVGLLAHRRELLGRKIAILPPTQEVDCAAAFALEAGNRGFHVRVFDGYEGAFEWFGDG